LYIHGSILRILGKMMVMMASNCILFEFYLH